MIIKFAAFLLVLFLVYIVFFKKNREKDTKENEQIMEACPKCKTFVSKEDAILSNGKYFCSKECL